MKLISCYIEGYGKIKRESFSFSNGITSFCKANGEGKTTLASFIKAMFYGLKGYTKKSVEFCDREHFYPFDGGMFGGNLLFEMNGKQYKIERTFGSKSEKEDALRVLVNGEETEELGTEIGKAVFGVDKESFERTLFLGSGEVEISSTAGIHARLNRFLEGGEEEGDLDGALLALEKAAKVYKKSKAGVDKVSGETARIAKLNEDIANARTVKLALEGKYSRAEELEREITELNARIVSAQEENEKFVQREHYDSLFQGAERARNALADLEKCYPRGLPTLEEVESVNAYMVRGKELQTEERGAVISPSDSQRLAVLEDKFREGVPSQEVLFSVEEEIKALTETNASLQLAERENRSARERELCEKFARSRPTPSQISLAASKVEEYKRAKKEYDETPAFLGGGGKKPTQKKYAVAASFFAFLLLLGGVLIATWNTLAGGGLLLVGGVGLLADGFLYLNKKSTGNVGGENPEKQRREYALREAEDGAKALLLPFGYCSGNGVAFDFATLQADVGAYEEYLREGTAREKERAEKRAQAEERLRSLTAFFKEYGLTGDSFVKLSADLRSLCREYADLRVRKERANEEGARLRRELQENERKIEEFKFRYALSEVRASLLTQDIQTAARLRAEIVDGEQKAAAYKREKGLGEQNFVKEDLALLQAQLQVKQSEKGKLEVEIRADERVAETLDGYESDKAEAEEKLLEYKRKHKLLTATAELLERAEGKLRDRYVSPIKREFLYYAELLERALGERVVMTKDFELRFERNGIERSEKHLSAGQRSICALCFRLALIKNMYREQTPFLVLDDPFASLDKTHVERVAQLLQALSKDMQMIYFTCHESRSIE